MTRLISLCVILYVCDVTCISYTHSYRDAFMVTSPGSSFSHTGHANYHSNLRSSSSGPLQLQLQPNTTSFSTSSSSSSWDVMCANGFILHGVYRDVYAYRSRYVVACLYMHTFISVYIHTNSKYSLYSMYISIVYTLSFCVLYYTILYYNIPHISYNICMFYSMYVY